MKAQKSAAKVLGTRRIGVLKTENMTEKATQDILTSSKATVDKFVKLANEVKYRI